MTNSELQQAIQSILQRLDLIAEQAGDSFPLYALPNEPWQLSKGGSWLGGFWAGCWWLKAKLTNDERDKQTAQTISARLADKTAIDSINRSFIFYYGATLGATWFDDVAAQTLHDEAAVAFALSYDAQLQGFPLGCEMGGGSVGGQRLSIDSLASIIDFLCPAYEQLAKQHTDSLLAACFNASGAWHSEADYREGHFHTEGNAGDWSRGQAWGMLGLSRAAARWGEPYLTHARAAASYWQQTRTQALPLNRLSEIDGLLDPSAAVIASLAMLNLAELSDDKPSWQDAARQQLIAVLRSEYFDAGRFSGCCYGIRPQQLALVETTWGYFLLLTALLTASE